MSGQMISIKSSVILLSTTLEDSDTGLGSS